MTTIATECPACPEGIVSCAHLGDRVVWLLDKRQVVPHEDGRDTSTERWCATGPAQAGRCRICSTGHIVLHGGNWHRTDSLPDAEAEYERRCALLRAEA